MPQIRIEYSSCLEAVFDRHGFALALHPQAAQLIGSPIGHFKTRCYAMDDVVIGDGDPSHAMVHVTFALLSGRSPKVKQDLGKLTLDLLQQAVSPLDAHSIQLTVEITDLDRANYHKAIVD